MNIRIDSGAIAEDAKSDGNLSNLLLIALDALAQRSSGMFTASSLSEAMNRCLECIRFAGYTGGMISLIAKQGKVDGIIGRAAIGPAWESIILERTVRKLQGNDVLAIVAKNKEPVFVTNAQTSPICHRRTARLGNIISFCAYPLINERNEVFGILQIDLGDVRNTKISPEQIKILDVLAQATGSALNRSILTDELKLMQEFDVLLPQCAVRANVAEAIAHFVTGASRILSADVHIRLLDDQNKSTLALVSGTGAYYEACLEHRPRIPIRHDSPGARAVRQKHFNVVNDADNDPQMKRLLLRVHKDIRSALLSVKAYANFPIVGAGNNAVGFVCIVSFEKYCLTPSRIRTLQHIVGRLSLLLSHIRQKMATESSVSELKFLQEISPPLKRRASIYELLNEHLKRIAIAARAEVASFFLLDEIQNRLVLRAQYGWISERSGRKWLDAASYEIGEGFTGFIADSDKAIYVPNLAEFAKQNHFKAGKWFPEMFGTVGATVNCEAIGLPLRFKGQAHALGALVLYSHLDSKSPNSNRFQKTRFATTDTKTLDKASRIYSAFVTALLSIDLSRWRMAQNRHLQIISRFLLKRPFTASPEEFQNFCRLVIKEYGFRHCAVYLSRGPALELNAYHARPDLSANASFNPGKQVSSYCMQVLRNGRPFTIPSIEVEGGRAPANFRAARIPEGVILPIKVDSVVVGLLLFLWKNRRRIRDTGFLPHHDLDRLQPIADYLGSSLKNKRRRDESRWQKLLLDRAQNRMVWESRAEACDQMADAIANGFQELESGIEAVRTALKEDFGRDLRVGQAIENLRHSQHRLLEKTRQDRASLLIPNEIPRRTSITEIISRSLKKLEPGINSKCITVKPNYDRNALNLRVPRRALAALVENLLFNIVAASVNDSSVLINVSSNAEKQIEIVLLDRADRIPDYLCDAINSLKAVQPSHGRAWDLSLIHRFAHAIGGTLSIRPDRGGSKITLMLPANIYAKCSEYFASGS